jgi:hypothetical protein
MKTSAYQERLQVERLVAVRLWERGYLRDDEVLRAMDDISRREAAIPNPIFQELDRQLEQGRER